jgi:hypothetical protein
VQISPVCCARPAECQPDPFLLSQAAATAPTFATDSSRRRCFATRVTASIARKPPAAHSRYTRPSRPTTSVSSRKQDLNASHSPRTRTNHNSYPNELNAPNAGPVSGVTTILGVTPSAMFGSELWIGQESWSLIFILLWMAN